MGEPKKSSIIFRRRRKEEEEEIRIIIIALLALYEVGMFSRRVSLTLALAPCWWSNQCKKVSVYVVLILIFCALPRRYKYYIQEYDE